MSRKTNLRDENKITTEDPLFEDFLILVPNYGCMFDCCSWIECPTKFRFLEAKRKV